LNAQSLESRLIKVRRTIALDLKAISDLEARIARKRRSIEALERDASKYAALLAKARK
jgi:uncharacterized coiled-coil protein SlyX